MNTLKKNSPSLRPALVISLISLFSFGFVSNVLCRLTIETCSTTRPEATLSAELDADAPLAKLTESLYPRYCSDNEKSCISYDATEKKLQLLMDNPDAQDAIEKVGKMDTKKLLSAFEPDEICAPTTIGLEHGRVDLILLLAAFYYVQQETRLAGILDLLGPGDRLTDLFTRVLRAIQEHGIPTVLTPKR